MDDALHTQARTGGQRASSDTGHWLARVAAIGPTIEAAAPDADRARRMTDEAMAAIHGQGLLRLLLPRDVGGIEMPLPRFFTVVESVAGYDGSAAWCICQGNACAMLAAYLEAPFARSIWVDDPSAVLAWGPGKASARAVDGGYSITADTGFASGSHHASWLAAHCLVVEADGSPRRDAEGVQENRTALIPAEQVALGDAWDAIGLRGTGSDGFVVEDLFVPEDHTIVRADMIEARPVRSSLHGLPLMTVYASGFAAVALGIGRAFLDAFLELARRKKPRGISAPLSDNPVVQDEVARGEARLSAARAFLIEEIDRGWGEIAATGGMSIRQRMRVRLAGTHAIHEAKAVVDTLYDTAGTSAVFAASPFERRFRDIHTVALQVQGRKRHYQSYGGWAMGQAINARDMSVI